METLQHFFSIQNTFFTVLGYPMSYLEFFGTLLNLWSVYLVMRNNLLTWPVGNLGVILFGFLFYQIQLYSDLLQQVYFLVTGFYGWWVWLRLVGKGKGEQKEPHVTYNSKAANLLCGAVILAGVWGLGAFMSHIHEIFPAAFPKPAAYPYFDALITLMSFTAQILMAHKKVECWYLWVALDVLSIGLYFFKQVYFVAILFTVFLVLASRGLWNWRKLAKAAA